MNEVNHTNQPEAVKILLDEVKEIKRLLLIKSNEQHQPEPDRWLDLNELIDYLPDKPAKATAYGWVHHLLIPFHKKSKKLFFLKSEVDAWLKVGRHKTSAEITSEAETYLENHKKKK